MYSGYRPGTYGHPRAGVQVLDLVRTVTSGRVTRERGGGLPGRAATLVGAYGHRTVSSSVPGWRTVTMSTSPAR